MRAIATFALATAVWSFATAADEPAAIEFGIISTESSMNLRKGFEPIAADMEKAIGKKVNLFFAPDYTGVIEAMRFNKVHIGWFGNKSAIECVDRANGEIFAQCIDKDGQPGYWSLIIVHKDCPLNTLDELLAKGKDYTFAMGDPQSTSGFLIPSYYAFVKNGVSDPSKHFKNYRSGANHEANALSVANKQVDGATFNTEAMFHLQAKQPEAAAKLKAIWKSPLIASDPLIYRNDLPADLKQKIREFFISYGTTSEAKEKLAPLKWSGFKPSTNAQLLPFRQLGLLKDKAKIEGDDKLSADEKATKLKDIDAKLATLAEQMRQAEAQAAKN